MTDDVITFTVSETDEEVACLLQQTVDVAHPID